MREEKNAAPAAVAGPSVYVAARECAECNHVGINDEHEVDAACYFCGWNGVSPDEDRCPSCKKDGAMTAACPKCSGAYRLLADANIASTPTTQAAPQQEPVAWRHSKTLCLYETKAEVPLADGDEWAEPLYLAAPQPAPVAQWDAEDAARYRCWRDAMIEDVGLQFTKAVSRALPDAVGASRRPTAHEWDAAIDAARTQAKKGGA